MCLDIELSVFYCGVVCFDLDKRFWFLFIVYFFFLFVVYVNFRFFIYISEIIIFFVGWIFKFDY